VPAVWGETIHNGGRDPSTTSRGAGNHLTKAENLIFLHLWVLLSTGHGTREPGMNDSLEPGVGESRTPGSEGGGQGAATASPPDITVPWMREPKFHLVIGLTRSASEDGNASNRKSMSPAHCGPMRVGRINGERILVCPGWDG